LNNTANNFACRCCYSHSIPEDEFSGTAITEVRQEFAWVRGQKIVEGGIQNPFNRVLIIVGVQRSKDLL
jgi:hypothetical protein